MPDALDAKSRLSKEIGPVRAHECHRTLVERTIQCAREFDTTIYTDGLNEDITWLCDLPAKTQIGDDLGVRMFHCFEDGVQVLVGTDCPVMTSEYIIEAFDALQTNDVVLGPTEDGGYALIGMNEPLAEMFTNIIWGEASVLEETMRRAQSIGVKVKLLSLIWDVDDAEDYKRWVQTMNDR